MGYYITNREVNNVVIKKENIDKALKALNKLGKERINLSWVYEDILANATNIVDAMDECRWDGEINDNGDFELGYFTGEKYGSDDIIFDTIAPYVEEGGYIEMQGEEGELWRWVFTNGECIEKSPNIIW